MKIKPLYNSPMKFKSLVKGDVFSIEGDDSFYMKVQACKSTTSDKYMNCVDLNTGSFARVGEDASVVYHSNAFLGFEDNGEI